ncbi:hydroxyacid dehydrogenase [Stenotrophomonas ginsengisoli]|uniref:Hydroxyacid dehydrogenase n=1 Tax=Stenotrophomonas ginsengisoli TaxID=336566 RepID=A0A0R0DIE5_9GAMM|nr:NAD(P)-dependent alcohol dehydrogenase [Stenotrophomonas ginsengisoli]KRG77905.1 hydroxyacid dehydrogenase [Stenotrophomonas ginsengisoli]
MSVCHAYAAASADAPLAPWSFERREPGANDIRIDIAYCGVCHSDLHTARGEWGGTLYPCVPGHEIVGKVTAIGSNVTSFKVGDLAGVGCLVDSCRSCESCQEGEEQYCSNGMTGTYNGGPDGVNTYGGYSDHIVVDAAYALHIKAGQNLAAVAPLLCAGITTYSPLSHWKVGPGQRVGVVGLGGLGHMAVKIAKAMGAHVVLFTTSEGKRTDALRLGADEVVISKDREQMKAQANSLHFILNTVAASHNLDPLIACLRRDGTMCLVGAPEHPHPSPQVFGLIMHRRSIAGSLIGGIRETQQMLDFCAKHGITADIEMIRADEINTAYERMLKGDVKYRFVMDMATLQEGAQ